MANKQEQPNNTAEDTAKNSKEENNAAAEAEQEADAIVNEVLSDDSVEDDEDEDEYEDDDEDFYEAERRRRAARRRRRKALRKRRKGRGVSCVLILLTLVLSASVLSATTILAVAKEMYGIDKDIDERMITIPAGSTVTEIAEQLQRENLIRLPLVFRAISRLGGSDGKYIAGEHELSPAMSYEAMIDELCKNHADEREYVKVTIKEGTTLWDAANLLEQNGVCDAEQFVFYFNAGGYGFKFEEKLTENDPMKFYKMEGYCFPDTYEFYLDEEPQIVAQKIYSNFDQKITSTDYKTMNELGMTLDQVITLASIVQAEAPTSSSMKHVASVFHNRLNNPGVYTQLQSDPTRKYAEEVISKLLELDNELMMNEYNTYIGQGLPPGAINNPGKEAINAVLYPAESNDFFFCANVNTGEIFYAEDNAGHNANLALIKAQQSGAALASDDEGNGDGGNG